MKISFVGYKSNLNDEPVEPEIVNQKIFEKNNFFELIFKKIKKFFFIISLFWVVFSLVFIFLGIILSTTLIGFLFGLIFLFIGIFSLVLFSRFLQFFIRFRRML